MLPLSGTEVNVTMSDRHYIEELRDMLSRLKHDSEFLYQYGSPGSSVDFFNSLSLDDRKRLIYLALTEGDKDVQNVAHYLMQKLSPVPRNLKELFAQLTPEDKTEFEKLMEDKQLRPKLLTIIDQQKITEELQKICNQIGFLEVEEAFWILIPNDPGEETLWIEAVGGKEDGLNRVRLPSQVMYDPTKEEKHDLITAMRGALWVLHVHNHPELAGYINSCEPSRNDLIFALEWKSVRPEIKGKMKFFVVKGKSVVEYSLPLGEKKQWQI